MKQLELSIIIVSYNTKELTIQTLQSVLADLADASQSLKDKTEILVIDNASTDDSLPALKKMATSAKILQVIAQKSNLGFAKANNLGLKQARGTYFLLLNSDTIVQPGALAALVATMKQHPIDETTAELSSYQKVADKLGLLAAELINPDGSRQAQGGSIPTLVSLATHMLMLDDIPLLGRFLPSTQHTGKRASVPSHSKLQSMGWVAATALLIRRQTLEQIGLLDEQIFMYGEDMELCIRAKNHNWDIAITQQAQVTHYGSASSSPARAIQGELTSYLYIWSKHKPFWQQRIAWLLIIVGARLRGFIFGTILRKQKRAEPYQVFLNQIGLDYPPTI